MNETFHTDNPVLEELMEVMKRYGGTGMLLDFHEDCDTILNQLRRMQDIALNRASANAWCAKFMKYLLKKKDDQLLQTGRRIVKDPLIKLDPAIKRAYQLALQPARSELIEDVESYMHDAEIAIF